MIERNVLDPWRPYSFFVEPEVGADGRTVPVATVLLTNRECPYQCVMCDLWRNTLEETAPPGAIPAQIRFALDRLPPAPVLKLYNAGSFFDPRAIPSAEDPVIADLCAGFERVVVECHPALIGAEAGRTSGFQGSRVPGRQDADVPGEVLDAGRQDAGVPGEVLDAGRQDAGVSGKGGTAGLPAGERWIRFAHLLEQRGVRLEVALGLETAHSEVLERLNKRMTLQQFRTAAKRLDEAGCDLRVFLLVRPPWLTEAEGVEWGCRSLDFAFDCGASVCSLCPTRGDTRSMEALSAAGAWSPPELASVEAVQEYGLFLHRGRVFTDLWEIERFTTCPECSPLRIARLRAMNETQTAPPAVVCRCTTRAAPASGA